MGPIACIVCLLEKHPSAVAPPPRWLKDKVRFGGDAKTTTRDAWAPQIPQLRF